MIQQYNSHLIIFQTIREKVEIKQQMVRIQYMKPKHKIKINKINFT